MCFTFGLAKSQRVPCYMLMTYILVTVRRHRLEHLYTLTANAPCAPKFHKIPSQVQFRHGVDL